METEFGACPTIWVDENQIRQVLLNLVQNAEQAMAESSSDARMLTLRLGESGGRVRLEVSAPDADPHIPSLVGVYPACNWHERETWDFFGIIFDGHPALTRIQMPDDWKGHPQRKDYPLGGIPVEYRGAKIPAPDERRHYS